MTANDLLSRLTDAIASRDSMLVAFSGGVDSTVLAVVAHRVLGTRMLAVLAESDTYPAPEIASARALAHALRLPHAEIHTDEMNDPRFAENTPDRCYYCKRDLLEALQSVASERGLEVVADGTNLDDLTDHRPGRRAAAELGVVSPIAEAGLTKADVRAVARLLELPNAEKPSMACLASRFPYGDRIDTEGLARVGRAEDHLRSLGLQQFRVRAHGPVARVEVAPGELEDAWRVREMIVAAVKEVGFAYVALDLEGYRTGALNEVLDSGESVGSAGAAPGSDGA
jgi:pyridinium-3,5-biscarboxylic acid mononucleotide sulfurtransferase